MNIEQSDEVIQTPTPIDPKTQKFALYIADVANQKLARDIVVQDVHNLSTITSYFIIATGINKRQVDAIVDEIVVKVKKEYGIKPMHRDGVESGTWQVLDFGDVIVHIFQPEDREHYRFEDLWNDAPVIDLSEAGLEDLEYSDRVKDVIAKAPREKMME